MAAGWYGKMEGQYGIRIDKQFIVTIENFCQLLLRPVLLTQETGTGGNGLLADGGSCGTDACRIKLHGKGRSTYIEFACLYKPQIAITLTGIRPQTQLPVEETVNG